MVSFLQELIQLSQSQSIIRRYFVVNGFDGTLTMMGLILGFILSDDIKLASVINVCMGTAIALCVSGVSSAYVSESAERKHMLQSLETAMVSNLANSDHAQAAQYVPIIVGLVNGLAPLLISLLVVTPLWLQQMEVLHMTTPLLASLVVASILLFGLGIVLSQVAGIPWYLSGLKTLLIGFATALFIYLFVGSP
jgi:predicted membrane protein (TIGR00267 family)